MISDSQKTVIDLVRLGLGFPADFFSVPENTDWREVIDIACQQGVGAIACDGLEIACENDSQLSGLETPENEALKYEWFGTLLAIESQYRAQVDAASRLSSIWFANGLKTVVMKGLALSQCYPKPEHKPCGDLDCVLQWNDSEEYSISAFECGNLLVEGQKIQVSRDYYKNSAFVFNGLSVENHRFCTQVRGHRKEKDLEKKLQELIADSSEVCIPGSHLYAPNVLFHALFLVEHAKNHFLREGITLRHICDWLMFKHKYNSQLDEKRFMVLCEEYGLSKFEKAFSEVASFIERPDASLDKLGSLLLEDVFADNVSTSSLPSSLNGRLKLIRESLKSAWKYRKFTNGTLTGWLFESVYGYIFDKNPEL